MVSTTEVEALEERLRRLERRVDELERQIEGSTMTSRVRSSLRV